VKYLTAAAGDMSEVMAMPLDTPARSAIVVIVKNASSMTTLTDVI
jgi:hypothetical protein